MSTSVPSSGEQFSIRVATLASTSHIDHGCGRWPRDMTTVFIHAEASYRVDG